MKWNLIRKRPPFDPTDVPVSTQQRDDIADLRRRQLELQDQEIKAARTVLREVRKYAIKVGDDTLLRILDRGNDD